MELSLITYADNPVGPWMDPIDDDMFRLVERWDYVWFQDHRYHRQVFLPGIVIDMASVPNCMGWLVDLHPNGPLGPGSLPHDVGYIFQGKNFPRGMFQRFENGQWVDIKARHSKGYEDKRFKRILQEGGDLHPVKIEAAYQAVSIGGWPGWWSDDTEDQIKIREIYECDY